MKYLFCFLILGAAFCSCTSPYGKKIDLNERIEVYIKEGATEEDARKLGTYIDTTWKGATSKKSFQLSKDSVQYTLRMVVDEERFRKDSSLDASFMAIQFLIEKDVFKNSKVKLIVTDNTFKDLKTFESSSGLKDNTDSSNVK